MRVLTKKHLVSHDMDQKEYRKKYGFTMGTPLAAKSLTKAEKQGSEKERIAGEAEKSIGGEKAGKG